MAGGAAGGALAGIIIANNIVRLKKGLALANTAWQGLEAKGLALGSEAVTGFAAASGETRPVLSGAIQGCDCSVRVVSDFVHSAHTRVGAKSSQPYEAVVGVHPSPAGLFGSIRAWLAQDIEIGDPEFDHAFLITAKPSEAAISFLTPSMKEAVAALAGASFAGLVIERGEVSLLFQGVETNVELLSLAVDVVIAAAHWRFD